MRNLIWIIHYMFPITEHMLVNLLYAIHNLIYMELSACVPYPRLYIVLGTLFFSHDKS